jgi:hypothetical protein
MLNSWRRPTPFMNNATNMRPTGRLWRSYPACAPNCFVSQLGKPSLSFWLLRTHGLPVRCIKKV